MVLTMLQCSVVGKWTAGAVGAENGKLRLNPEVGGRWLGRSRQGADQAQDLKAPHLPTAEEHVPCHDHVQERCARNLDKQGEGWA